MQILSKKYVVSEQLPIAVWFIAEMIDEDFYRDYFGIDCIEEFVKNFLEIETLYNFKNKKERIFAEDKLYQDSTDICHMSKKRM